MDEEEIIRQFFIEDLRRKSILDKNDLREIRKLVTKKIDEYEIDLVETKCYEIANEISKILNELNLSCKKISVFADGKITGLTEHFRWVDHTAIIVNQNFQGGRGIKRNELKIIDPLLSKKIGERCMFFYFEKWITIMSNIRLKNEEKEIFISQITYPSRIYKPKVFIEYNGLVEYLADDDQFLLLPEDPGLIENFSLLDYL